MTGSWRCYGIQKRKNFLPYAALTIIKNSFCMVMVSISITNTGKSNPSAVNIHPAAVVIERAAEGKRENMMISKRRTDSMKYMAMLGLLMIALTCDAYAEKMYVSNIIKVTLRTGAGIDHKVIQMLQSGNEVEVLEPGGDWSRVRSTTGKEGWILSRFLSPEMPSDLMLDALQEKYDKQLARTSVLEIENAKYVEENKRLASELE
jgi:hypothetical protein